MVAQGAHASLGAVLPYVGNPPVVGGDGVFQRHQEAIDTWLSDSFTKICVRANSEEELLFVHDKAKQAGLIVCLITDSWRTEFNGVPTITCCAIGPATDEQLEPITGGLKLL